MEKAFTNIVHREKVSNNLTELGDVVLLFRIMIRARALEGFNVAEDMRNRLYPKNNLRMTPFIKPVKKPFRLGLDYAIPIEA
jgi:hypothetical protein